jgi:hypothetical protein
MIERVGGVLSEEEEEEAFQLPTFIEATSFPFPVRLFKGFA